MGGMYVGYDQFRLITLRRLLLDAADGLQGIRSSDPEAGPAIASVGRVRLLLETEYLPAVDELCASDALARTAFGVGLTAGISAAFLLSPTWLDVGSGPITPTGYEEWTDDELLEHLTYQMAERDVSTFDADSMAAREKLYRELGRRLSGPGAEAFTEQLSERIEGIQPAISGVADQLTNRAANGDAVAAGALAAMTTVVLRVSEHDEDLEQWLKQEAIDGSYGATQVLLADADHAADADLLLAIAAASFARLDDLRSTHSMTLGEDATFTELLDRIAVEPDTAAALLSDETALATMLRSDADLADDSVEAVFTAGLARPLVERRGQQKSLEQANAELIGGWQVWNRAFDHGTPASFQNLDTGAARGFANSLHLYLPSLSSGLLSENRTGGERPAEQQVFALVGDEHVEVANWGQVGMMLGHISRDDEGAATLRSTAYAFTMLQLDLGLQSAATMPGGASERSGEIGRMAAPAVELNHLLYIGIGMEEDIVQHRHAEAQASRKLMADMVIETGKKLALKNPMLDLATTPAQEWFDAQVDDWMTSAPPQLSREVPLDYPSVFRASFLDSIADADIDALAHLGLGAVSAKRWADIRAATKDYWNAPDSQARNLANQRIEKLTNDEDERGDVDEEGRAIARAYHEVRTSSGLGTWRPPVDD